MSPRSEERARAILGAAIRSIRDDGCVTKVDEKAVVPAVDRAARTRLAAALDREGVVAASLFGSQASGRVGPLSDVDIGVWVETKLSRRARAEIGLSLARAAADAARTDEVDLVILNDAPPLLGHRVIRDGIRLLERDPRVACVSRPKRCSPIWTPRRFGKRSPRHSADGSQRAALVDAERARARLQRLEHLIERLEEVRGRGEAAYLADQDSRAATERWLQLAIQACIDVAAQLAAELSVEPPSDYAAAFTNLARAGYLPQDLADRLAAAARQRNLLVHLHLDVDDRQVFAALARLDDLRELAVHVERLIDEA